MEHLLLIAALWIGLAVISTFISAYLHLTAALIELIIGALAQYLIFKWFGQNLLDPSQAWVLFLASAGAVMLTFLAGIELDPQLLKKTWKAATAIGILSFLVPFLGCTALAYYGLQWTGAASWLTGIALSTTSVAVVYAVMLESGLNNIAFGKIILAACFITDLVSVLVLGFMFAPFSSKTLAFFAVTLLVCFILPWFINPLFKSFGNKHTEFEAKFLIFLLFGLGALAVWAGSEAVLPSYILGVALAGTIGKNQALVKRLRTVTMGFLTPFYFIRTGCLVSIPSIIAAPMLIIVLLVGIIFFKTCGVYPVTRFFSYRPSEGIYTALLMSTGLTFGSIAALYGLTHEIINLMQYSCLIAAIIGSAIVPTIIANLWFLPRHLLRG